jgi:anti-sigma factor RsiW
MSNCRELEPLVTAWIDGVAAEADRQAVEGHLRVCPPCRTRAQSEAAVRALVRGRADGVLRGAAPPALRERCLARPDAGAADAARPPIWRTVRAGALRLPLAAALVFALTGLFIYALTVASPTTLAAQLTLDHIKCFTITGDPHAPVRAEVVEAHLDERYGWAMDVPGDSPSERLRLVGSRRCLYGEGTIAHVLYRHNGAPLSLFMLPDKVRPAEIVEVLGHAAIIWPGENRTFVLVGSESRADMEIIAGYIRNMVK